MTLVILAHHVLVRLRLRLMHRDPATTCALAASRLPEPPEGEGGAFQG